MMKEKTSRQTTAAATNARCVHGTACLAAKQSAYLIEAYDVGMDDSFQDLHFPFDFALVLLVQATHLYGLDGDLHERKKQQRITMRRYITARQSPPALRLHRVTIGELAPLPDGPNTAKDCFGITATATQRIMS